MSQLEKLTPIYIQVTFHPNLQKKLHRACMCYTLPFLKQEEIVLTYAGMHRSKLNVHLKQHSERWKSYDM